MSRRMRHNSAARFLIGGALVLWLFALFQPWISERFLLWWWGRPHVSGESKYWSFQAVTQYGPTQNHFVLNDFWFTSSETYSGHSGIYYGWLTVFLSQLLAIILGTIYVFKPTINGRNWHMDAAFGSFILSPTATLYQHFVQREIQSAASFEYLSVTFSSGFGIAVTSTLLFIIAYWITKNERLKSILARLRTQWKKTIIATVPICLALFCIMNEFQSQTDVTKWLVVARKMGTYPSDPKHWENDFNTITTIATVFRGKIIYNQPSYAYCTIAVPIASFHILLATYTSMGYEAYQSIPLHLL